MEQTTDDGVTVDQIDATYEVLEVIREGFREDDMSDFENIMNEAHYLVQQYDEGSRWSPKWDLPEEGEIVVDTEANTRYGDGRVRVEEVVGDMSSEVTVDDAGKGWSVAEHNPGHPADAPVVSGSYVGGSAKLYHFPCTRLESFDDE